jgi:type IV secretory pathway VirB2 component (pilin)
MKKFISFFIFSLFILLCLPVYSASTKTYNGTYNETEVGGECRGGHNPEKPCLSSLYKNVGYTSFMGDTGVPSNFVLTFDGENDNKYDFKNGTQIQCTGEPTTKNGVEYLKNATCKKKDAISPSQWTKADDGVGSKSERTYNSKKGSGYTDDSLLGRLLGDAFKIKIFSTNVNDKNTAFYIIAMQVQYFLLAIVGILFVIMFIFGGILYITSSGNEQRAAKGKAYLTYAIGGLILVILAEVIVQTIVGLSNTFAGGSTLYDSLNSIKTYLLGGVGFLAVLFIIIGGLQLVTARGNSEQMTKAKKTLTYSIIGLIVVLLAEVIFVLINSFFNSVV